MTDKSSHWSQWHADYDDANSDLSRRLGVVATRTAMTLMRGLALSLLSVAMAACVTDGSQVGPQVTSATATPTAAAAPTVMVDYILTGTGGLGPGTGRLGAVFEADYIVHDAIDGHFVTYRRPPARRCDDGLDRVHDWRTLGVLTDPREEEGAAGSDLGAVTVAEVIEVGTGPKVFSPTSVETTMNLMVEYSDDCRVFYTTNRAP